MVSTSIALDLARSHASSHHICVTPVVVLPCARSCLTRLHVAYTRLATSFLVKDVGANGSPLRAYSYDLFTATPRPRGGKSSLRVEFFSDRAVCATLDKAPRSLARLPSLCEPWTVHRRIGIHCSLICGVMADMTSNMPSSSQMLEKYGMVGEKMNRITSDCTQYGTPKTLETPVLPNTLV